MTIEERIVAANEHGQAAFKAMIDAGVWSDRNAALTQAYELAERKLDLLLDEARWAWSHPEAEDLSLGDHHIGIGQ